MDLDDSPPTRSLTVQIINPDADLPPTNDSDALTDEAGADVDEDEVDEFQVERSRRVKKPVVRLSYDELEKPLTVLSHAVLVGSGTYRDKRCHPCQTSWCHPMALCHQCFSLQPSRQYKQVQVF